jgi:hypothetical protein
MNGPKCRMCGEKHWPADGCRGERQRSWIARRFEASTVTPSSVTPQPVTGRVTDHPVTERVTERVTWQTPVTERVTVTERPCPECERLRARIADLETQLRDIRAEARVPAMTAAERQRRSRQRRREAADWGM